MIEYKTVSKKVTTSEIDDVICDMCGQSCRVDVDGYVEVKDGFAMPMTKLLYATLEWNFEIYPNDVGVYGEMHFCEKCVAKIQGICANRKRIEKQSKLVEKLCEGEE